MNNNEKNIGDKLKNNKNVDNNFWMRKNDK